MECKYYNKCELASEKAFVCTKGGGSKYCGKYRVISAESSSDPVGFFCHPIVYIRELIASLH